MNRRRSLSRSAVERIRMVAMAQRSNHYEAAFEAFIRSIRVPCVAVDEAKRALVGDDALKNPDFLLYPRFGPNLVVEVKGKRAKNTRGRRDWENWVTTDDLDSLVRWQTMFGAGFARSWLSCTPSRSSRSPCRETTARTSSGGSSIASGLSVSTITSPICARVVRHGRPSPWPAARFAAAFAPYSNGFP